MFWNRFLLLFLFGVNFVLVTMFFVCSPNLFAVAKVSDLGLKEIRKYSVQYEDKIFNFYSDEFVKIDRLSKYQRDIILDKKNINLNIKKLKNMGLSDNEICRYIFPESEPILNKLMSLINIQAEPSFVEVNKNKCSLNYNDGDFGEFVNIKKFYNDVFEYLSKGKTEIFIKIETEKFKDEFNAREEFKEKGCFSTKFSTSSPERKNNIRLALSKFDGLVLEEGEILSFNKTTGIRNESNGYMAAKIISNGTFVDGFGGGVCQVSTTIYNACLLSGLEILEVHNHSLPVSYVEPSFDAMVNSGSSDLLIRNNTNGKIIFTTSYEGDVCKVKIFGKRNKYKITRISEKTKIIPAESEFIDKDFEKYGLFDLEIGQEKRLSYAKEGFYSNAYLNFYDEKGNLIKTQKIRENRYNPTRGIIVKREK